MHDAEFGKAQRQVAIAFQPVLEDLHMAGAVHRLEREPALVFRFVAGRLRREHVLAIPVPVAGRLPQRLVEDLRRVDLLIVGGETAAHIGNEALEQRPALGMPEHHAGAFFLEVEEVHLASEPAVVALLGFLELLEIEVEVFRLGKRSAVDAGQHRLRRVAAPVGARDLHQLEGAADLAGRGHVRTAAQVEPVALLVDLDRLVLGDGVDQLDLEVLALLLEHAFGLVARPHLLGEGSVARDDLAHLLLDGGEVFRRERLVAEEVVIEAVVDDGADRHLRAGPQVLHGFCKDMRGVVADQFQRARILARDELDLCVRFDRIGEVGDHAVERHRDRALGERGRDTLGDVEAGRACGKIAYRAVGKGDSDCFRRGHGL